MIAGETRVRRPDEPDLTVLLEARNLRRAFGGNVVVDGASFTIGAGQVTGLIGPNGAGKTTVFNLITGFIPLDEGELWFKGQRINTVAPHRIVTRGIVRTFQELRLFDSLSVRDNLIMAMPGQPGEQVWSLFLRWRHSDRYEAACRARAQELLHFVGLSHVAEAAASDLSYGQQKRVALARALAAEADLICLDEPAAGLDPEAIEDMIQLIGQLVEQKKTILLVEHNLEIVRQVCHQVLFLDQGQVIVSGPPETVLNDPRVFRGFMGI
jgi:ABC-type branched-subunit amino acid transport system ATPase component